MTDLPPAALAAAEEIVQLLDECADVPSFKAGVAEIIARHTSAPASDGEVEAAIEAVEAAVKLAPLEYVSPDGSHVYEPANSKRRLKEAARLLRSLPALRAENERLTALLERNRE